MKRFLCALLFILLFGLCACTDEPVPTTTTTAVPTSTATEPRCIHAYQDADCVTAKTCTLCGATRGDPMGHDYTEGICSRCGAQDSTYVPLLFGNWCTEALHETGRQIERISLLFSDDGTAMFAAGIYDRLADVPEDMREDYMLDEENWLDYSGEIYFYTGFGVANSLNYTVDGNVITCTFGTEEEIIGTMILERTAGNMLTVTYFEGSFSIIYLQVGDVLVDRP